MLCTVLLHNSCSNLHTRYDYYTFLHPCFWPFDTIHNYTHHCHFQLILSVLYPQPAAGRLMISQKFLLVGCCSPLLCKCAAASSWLRATGVHSILIGSGVYICFIFRLSLDPGRWKEAQSFPRERIFLQEDRRRSLWVTQSLSTTSQSLRPQALPSPAPTICFLYFSLQLQVSLFLYFPLNAFHHSQFPSVPCKCSYIQFCSPEKLEYATFMCGVQGTFPPR